MTTVDLGRLRRSWAEPAGLVAWLCDGRPQADRPPLRRHRGGLLPRRRRRGGGDARPARAARRAPVDARGIRPALLDARADDDLPLRHADALGLRELPRAADDRSAGHGVPAPERVRLLGLPRRRADHVRRAAPRNGAGQRLVQLCAAVAALVQPGHEHRLLRGWARLPRHLDDRRRDQLHRHDLQAPRAGDVARPVAPLLLGDPRDLVLDRRRHPVAHRRLPSALPATQLRLPLLRHGGWRRPPPVAAPVLDLRPPRRLHHLPARRRDRLVDRADLLAAADGRLHADGLRDDGDRRARLRRLGAPHVRDGATRAVVDVFRGREPRDRDSERDPGLRVARDDDLRASGPLRRHCSTSSASSSPS